MPKINFGVDTSKGAGVTVEWKTKDGRKMRICDMTDSHLTNTINLYWRLVAAAPQGLVEVVTTLRVTDWDAIVALCPFMPWLALEALHRNLELPEELKELIPDSIEDINIHRGPNLSRRRHPWDDGGIGDDDGAWDDDWPIFHD